MADDLTYLSISEASARFTAGALSPVELTEAHLRRIETLDGKLSAFLLVTAERALADAKAAEIEIGGGRHRGPLHGIPFGLKDVYDTADIATTGNSAAYKDRIPARDAFAASRLKDAGAVLLGKQATHELTYGGVSDQLPWPPPRNPWNPDYDTGGSSSGSGAAVAAGMSMFAMGSDTGGSVRNPAAHCGVVGLKPSTGLIGRTGVMKNSVSFDHCGPLARTVRDLALVLDAVAGFDPDDPASVQSDDTRSFADDLDEGIEDWKIGVLADLYQHDLVASAEARAAMDAALAQLASLGAKFDVATIAPVERYARCKATIQKPEIYEEYRADLAAQPDAFGGKFRTRVADGAGISAADYLAAQRERAVLTAEMIALFDRFDILVTAGPLGPATLADACASRTFDQPEITVPFSLTGVPAIVVCIGFAPSTGIPIAMQIVGPPRGDRAVLRAAHAYQTSTGWHERHPIPRSRTPGR